MYGTFQKEIMMSERTALRVALVGAGAAGQAHAFGYRNVSMAAGLESVQIDTPVLGSRSGAYPVWPRCTTSWPPMRLARCTVSPRGTTRTTRPRPTHRSAGDTRRRPQAPVR